MKRLLCIVGQMSSGGAETFLMKVFRKLDKSQYQMDFCVTAECIGLYESEILTLGGKVYRVPPKTKNVWKNFFGIQKLIKDENYKYVLRVSQHSLSALELLACRLGGARVLAYRSSNSKTGGDFKCEFLHSALKWMPICFANVKIAPSFEAANFMFGKRNVRNGKVTIINNGLDLNVFRFSQKGRDAVRKEFNLKDKFVVGHVGRLTVQKNHEFLIKVFRRIKENRPNAILLLVGTGELENKIRDEVNNLELSGSVIFAGMRTDIPDVLSAMDVFVFPSFYEGMPNTVIEAQSCSLPCVVSSSISKDVKITDLVYFLSLDESAERWCDEALAITRTCRENYYASIKKAGYDIDSVVTKFTETVFCDK